MTGSLPSGLVAVEMHLGITENPAFEQLEYRLDRDRHIAALFQNGERA